jgi:hypothetical protein
MTCFDSSSGPHIIKQTPNAMAKRLSMNSMSKIFHTWLDGDADDKRIARPAEAQTSRKRVHDSAQISMSTKKQKGTNSSAKPSCYNLSILFSNFQ